MKWNIERELYYLTIAKHNKKLFPKLFLNETLLLDKISIELTLLLAMK